MEKYFEEPIEKFQTKLLEFKLLAYCFIKEQLPNKPNKLLQEFKDLYAYSAQGSTCKSIYTTWNLLMKILTLPRHWGKWRNFCCVGLNSEYREEYVILIGDGKIYQHLKELKTIYGIPLEKLLIFPGDCQIFNLY